MFRFVTQRVAGTTLFRFPLNKGWNTNRAMKQQVRCLSTTTPNAPSTPSPPPSSSIPPPNPACGAPGCAQTGFHHHGKHAHGGGFCARGWCANPVVAFIAGAALVGAIGFACMSCEGNKNCPKSCRFCEGCKKEHQNHGKDKDAEKNKV